MSPRTQRKAANYAALRATRAGHDSMLMRHFFDAEGEAAAIDLLAREAAELRKDGWTTTLAVWRQLARPRGDVEVIGAQLGGAR